MIRMSHNSSHYLHKPKCPNCDKFSINRVPPKTCFWCHQPWDENIGGIGTRESRTPLFPRNSSSRTV